MAIECKINRGYQIGCKATGGISEVYIGNWLPVTLTKDQTNDSIVTAVTAKDTTITEIDIYRVEQKAEWAGNEGSGVHNAENDTVHVSDVLSITTSVLDADNMAFLKMLRRSNSFAIVRSVMGQLYLLGAEIPGSAIESTQGIGKAFEDRNGGTVNIEYKSLDGMYLLDEDALTSDFKIVEPATPTP